MQAWWMLFKKEWRFGLPLWWWGLAVTVGFHSFSLYVEYKSGDGTGITMAHAAFAMMLFYLPGHLLYSLFKEMGQGHLWLHSPLSGARLLGVKLVSSLTGALVLYSVSWGFTVATLPLQQMYGAYPHMVAFLNAFRDQPLTVLLDVLAINLYDGICALLLFTVVESVKYRIGRWRWLLLVVLIVAPPMLLFLFEQTSLYAALFFWGEIATPYPMLIGPHLEESVLFVGESLFYLVQFVLLFWLAARLFDRKVEV